MGAAAVACASFGPARAQDAPKAPMVAYTSHKDGAGFVLRRPATALLGPFGYAIWYAAGRRLLTEEGIADPSAAIAYDVAARLAERLSGALAAAPVEVSGDKTKSVATAASGARLAVDVLNRGWGTWANGLEGFYYSYDVRLLVVDPASGAALITDGCSWPGPQDVTPAPYDELFADHDKELRRRIGLAAEACRKQFLSKIDGLKL